MCIVLGFWRTNTFFQILFCVIFFDICLTWVVCFLQISSSPCQNCLLSGCCYFFFFAHDNFNYLLTAFDSILWMHSQTWEPKYQRVQLMILQERRLLIILGSCGPLMGTSVLLNLLHKRLSYVSRYVFSNPWTQNADFFFFNRLGFFF